MPKRILTAVLAAATLAGCQLLQVAAPAFEPAGWSASPGIAVPGFAEAGGRLCDPGTTDPPILNDQRGPDAAALLWSGSPMVACLVFRADDGAFFVDQRLEMPADSPGLQPSTTGGETGHGSLVAGTLELPTAAVTLTLENGTEVSASVADRGYVAWWPGLHYPVLIVATDSAGKVVSRTTLP